VRQEKKIVKSHIAKEYGGIVKKRRKRKRTKIIMEGKQKAIENEWVKRVSIKRHENVVPRVFFLKNMKGSQGEINENHMPFANLKEEGGG